MRARGFLVTYTDRPVLDPFRRWPKGEPPPFLTERFDTFEEALDWVETAATRQTLFVPVITDLSEGQIWSWPEIDGMLAPVERD